MMTGYRVIAVIPARGGSKSVPGKNIRLLAGKPLIAWAVNVALEVEVIDRIIVSTDSDEIAEVAWSLGAEVYERPAHLATDTALIIETITDLHRTLKKEQDTADIIVLLEPTCPFRRPEDIRACLQRLQDDGLDSVATFKPAEVNPHRTWRIEGGIPSGFIPDVDPWLPRQKLPDAYQLNGAVYAFFVNRMPNVGASLLFGHCGAVLMPPERSVDIDDELDFIVAGIIGESI
ncbi:MAG: cytidylyltransferase domain-containing protein [Pseudomonadota bacterium]